MVLSSDIMLSSDCFTLKIPINQHLIKTLCDGKGISPEKSNSKFILNKGVSFSDLKIEKRLFLTKMFLF